MDKIKQEILSIKDIDKAKIRLLKLVLFGNIGMATYTIIYKELITIE